MTNQTLTKPHIRILRSSGAVYECQLPGGAVTGWGDTPEQAYKNWAEMMRSQYGTSKPARRGDTLYQ